MMRFLANILFALAFAGMVYSIAGMTTELLEAWQRNRRK